MYFNVLKIANTLFINNCCSYWLLHWSWTDCHSF